MSSPIVPSPLVDPWTNKPFSYLSEIASPSIFSSHTYSYGSPAVSRTLRSKSRRSASLKAFARLSIGVSWTTLANPDKGSPPTLCVGESGVINSGCAFSISCSSRKSLSYSASGTLGRSST
ncbi:hypothetical protein BCO26_2646 [Heyndrickxia coagulans 2-6]|nr:hypothetical protein BCO26_2646 [Heyndrickxia coagulans 2-6]